MSGKSESRNGGARGLFLALWVSMALVFGAVAAAQDEAAGVFGEVLDVRVINLEVVVEDKDGVRVNGLTPEDFLLTVDGLEVQIEYFSEIFGGTAVARGDETANPAVPAQAPGEPVSTSYLVFIDEYYSIVNDRNRILDRLIGQLPMLDPEDRMAIVAFDGKNLEMLSTWSHSVPALTRVLEKARERPAFGLQREAEQRTFSSTRRLFDSVGRGPVLSLDDTFATQLDIEERQQAELVGSQVKRVVLATTSALRGFANPPGRKVMLLLSGGWPYNPVQWVVQDPARAAFATAGFDLGDDLYRPLIDTANRLSYTLYPVDVPALEDDLTTAEVSGAIDQAGIRNLLFDREQDEETTLRSLARETGGKAMLNAASYSAFERVVTDTRSYYWLGFTPTWKGDDASHKVRIQARRKGLKVRTRRTYSDLSRQTEVTMMVESALLFGNPPTSTPLIARVGETKKAGRGKALMTLQIGVPLSALTFLPQDQELWVADTELRIAVLDEEGNTAEIPVIPLMFRARRLPLEGDIMPYETSVKIRRKKHDLVVSLYDKASGKILSNRIEVEPRF